MQYKVIFYDITAKWEDEITTSSPISCIEAAKIALQRRDERCGTLDDAVFRIDNSCVQAEKVLQDGECLYVFRLIGGG